MTATLCISIDVELPPYPVDDPAGLAEQGMERILDVLAAHDIPATCFINGEFLDATTTDRTDRIHAAGHEIAAHADTHTDLRGASADRTRREVDRITGRLRDRGVDPRGFRAPNCAYTGPLLDALAAAGYDYGSSLHPTWVPGRYNNLRAPRTAFEPRPGLLEIPPSVAPVVRAPLAWAWFRLFGVRYATAVARAAARDGYAVMYVHPWEFADLPDAAPWYARFRTGDRFASMLDAFLDRTADRFVPATMAELADDIRSEGGT